MRKVLFRSLLLTAIVAAVFCFYYALPDVNVLKKKNPKSSALMELRDQEYKQKNIRVARQQIWVPYGAVSDHLKKAILLSEDAGFFSHSGVDMNELGEAFKKDWETGSFKRGGSTITMQLAKNLYLNPSKNPLRKVKSVVNLDPLEAVTLAALLPSPRSSRERNLLYRRNLILDRLARVGYLSAEEYNRVKEVRLFQKVEEQAPLIPQQD